MISESVIIFGATGNVVMVLNDQLPKGSSVMFKVGASKIELMASDSSIIYTERGLNTYVCQRLKQKNEIGIIEVMDPVNPPKVLNNVIYQAAH
jgi:hypothetical protein